MRPLIIVALGGGIGSVARYLLSGWVLHRTANWQFPLGTFVVNLLGCLIIGILAGSSVKADLFSSDVRLFLFTGIIGGFTTFSAFGLDIFYLLRRGEILIAGGYAVSSLVISLIALWIGFSIIPHQHGG